MTTLTPLEQPAVKDDIQEIKKALANPIGTRTLKEISKGKKSAVIVVNDITRPSPTYKLVLPLVEELNEAGIKNEKIFFMVATGTHRDNTRRELEAILGKGILEIFNVYNHHCQDEDDLVDLGATRDGVPVVINRKFWEAEVKILTGNIEPHQSAGF